MGKGKVRKYLTIHIGLLDMFKVVVNSCANKGTALSEGNIV